MLLYVVTQPNSRFNCLYMSELKDNTPLYGCEIDEVKQHVNRKGVIVLGGKDSEAYKDGSIRSSVYSDIYKQLKAVSDRLLSLAYHNCPSF